MASTSDLGPSRPSLLRRAFGNRLTQVAGGIATLQILGGVAYFTLVHPGDYGANVFGLFVSMLGVFELGIVLVGSLVLAAFAGRPNKWEREAARQAQADAEGRLD